jgi:pSer/pThr/pTyr-binding forkhead associated (FHA) protein
MSRPVRLLERDARMQLVREVVIGQEEFLLGRGADCDLRLADDSVSRHHCLLRFGSSGAEASDMQSSNGTFVNGQRVISTQELHSGDVIRVGSSSFLLDLGDGPAVDVGLPQADPAAATMRVKPPGA